MVTNAGVLGHAARQAPILERRKQLCPARSFEPPRWKDRAVELYADPPALRFSVAGRTRTMNPGDWLVMPPHESHDLSALEPTQFLLTLVKG